MKIQLRNLFGVTPVGAQLAASSFINIFIMVFTVHIGLCIQCGFKDEFSDVGHLTQDRVGNTRTLALYNCFQELLKRFTVLFLRTKDFI